MARGKPRSFDRDEVLAKAMALFWRKGFQNTGMSELLEHMGIQRQSFYNTFGSKEKAYHEALMLYTRTITRQLTDLLERPGNPLDNVRQVLAMMQDMVTGEEACGCFLGNAIAEFGRSHADIGELLKDKISRLKGAYARAFNQAIEQGLLPESKDPDTMAQSLIVIIQGMALLSKLGCSDEMLDGVAKTAEGLMTP